MLVPMTRDADSCVLGSMCICVHMYANICICLGSLLSFIFGDSTSFTTLSQLETHSNALYTVGA